jgi:arylsulfatase A-like enzyme
MHRDHGLLVAEGPGIRAGHSVDTARIVDLAPTCLHWLGLDVPGDMDGRALEEVFADEYRYGHPVRVTQPSLEPSARGERVFSPSEEQEILQRLRDLGYLN